MLLWVGILALHGNSWQHSTCHSDFRLTAFWLVGLALAARNGMWRGARVLHNQRPYLGACWINSGRRGPWQTLRQGFAARGRKADSTAEPARDGRLNAGGRD